MHRWCMPIISFYRILAKLTGSVWLLTLSICYFEKGTGGVCRLTLSIAFLQN